MSISSKVELADSASVNLTVSYLETEGNRINECLKDH